MGMPQNFMAGVIEGFYGQPWSQLERAELFGQMSDWGLNTYLYGPKDDLKHRALWRELYSDDETNGIRWMVEQCQKRGLDFVYALGPGLDIHYSSEDDLQILRRRFEQLKKLGCRSFAILFDDIPDKMHSDDARWFENFAAAQCHVASQLFHALTPERFFFCPTPYCGRMASRELGGRGYLEVIGRELAPEIHVFWTGPEIISETISVAHVRELQQTLRRKPVIWDNLHANDYDGHRFYVGPYSGRPPAIKDEVAGILSNPNNEFPLNFVPLRTLAKFVNTNAEWNPREEYLAAMKEWWSHFETVAGKISFDDHILLGDCYYLPHSEGPEAEALFESKQFGRFSTKAKALKDTCIHLASLRDRRLFYALSRRIWELREELDLLERFGAHPADEPFTSDFHLLKTYRGGFVGRMERMFAQQPDGSLKHE